jgi:hypothetical protein
VSRRRRSAQRRRSSWSRATMRRCSARGGSGRHHRSVALDDLAAFVRQVLHRRIDDRQLVVRCAQLRDDAPILFALQPAAGHRWRDQQHGAGSWPDGGAQCSRVEPPVALWGEAQWHELRNATRKANSIQPPGVGRIRLDDFAAEIGSSHPTLKIVKGSQGSSRAPPLRNHSRRLQRAA